MEINVSEAIVPFKETIINPPKFDLVNERIQSNADPGRADYKKDKAGDQQQQQQQQQQQLSSAEDTKDNNSLSSKANVHVQTSDKRYTFTIRAKVRRIFNDL